MKNVILGWRMYRRLWHIECSEQLDLFREQHRASARVLVPAYLTGTAFLFVVGIPSALGLLSTGGREGATWTELILGANAFGLLVSAIAFITLRKTVIRVDPSHLHVGWRGIDLRNIVKWQRVEGALTRKWRRKLRRPMGYSTISQASWMMRGNVPGVFCPIGMQTALLIGRGTGGEPEYVLVGTTRPEEFEEALGQATARLKPREPGFGRLDEYLDGFTDRA